MHATTSDTSSSTTSPTSPAVLDGWLTRQQLADEMNLTVRTLARWRWARRGPKSAMVGGRRMYRRSDVEAWMRSLVDEAAA